MYFLPGVNNTTPLNQWVQPDYPNNLRLIMIRSLLCLSLWIMKARMPRMRKEVTVLATRRRPRFAVSAVSTTRKKYTHTITKDFTKFQNSRFSMTFQWLLQLCYIVDQLTTWNLIGCNTEPIFRVGYHGYTEFAQQESSPSCKYGDTQIPFGCVVCDADTALWPYLAAIINA